MSTEGTNFKCEVPEAFWCTFPFEPPTKQVVYVLSEEVWTEDGQEHIVHGVYSSLALAEAAIEHLMQETKRVKKTRASSVIAEAPRHRLSDFEIHDYQVTTSVDDFPPLTHLDQVGD